MATVDIQIAQLLKEKTVKEGRDPRINPITQDELAKAVGVPPGTISRWIGNKVDRLDKSMLVKFCLYFECEIGDLLKFTRDEFRA